MWEGSEKRKRGRESVGGSESEGVRKKEREGETGSVEGSERECGRE